jgi:hypothetical protein
VFAGRGDSFTMTTNTRLRVHLGEPQISGPLAIFPIFGPRPRLRYRSLGQAVKHGAFVTEVDDHGSVNDVLICNASDQTLLLYEGELIIGARQNRVIDQPVLVPAGVELSVPVSCVEQGRWDNGQRAAKFRPAPQAADPAMRRAKRVTANSRGVSGGEARAEQAEVWREVDERLRVHQVASPSAAFTELFDAKRPALDEFTESVWALDGQMGALVEIAGSPVALDLVSRPRVFADLLPRLASGYALQALEARHSTRFGTAEPSVAAAEGFLEAVLGAGRQWLPTPGMGDAFVPTGASITGSGLRAEGELIALSAFPAMGG